MKLRKRSIVLLVIVCLYSIGVIYRMNYRPPYLTIINCKNYAETGCRIDECGECAKEGEHAPSMWGCPLTLSGTDLAKNKPYKCIKVNDNCEFQQTSFRHRICQIQLGINIGLGVIFFDGGFLSGMYR